MDKVKMIQISVIKVQEKSDDVFAIFQYVASFHLLMN